MALTVEQIQAHMDASTFIASLGIEVRQANAEAETLTVVMPFKTDFERAPGSNQFHGGPIAALIDTVGCYALVMLTETGLPTINFRTDYLRPSINTDLHAVAKVRRAGRTVGLVDVDVMNNDGKLVAVGRGTFGMNAA